MHYGPITVPLETLFVLGDHRRMANDSRSYGPVPFENNYGRARIIYWLRKYEFLEPPPGPAETIAFPGTIRWDRIGMRL